MSPWYEAFKISMSPWYEAFKIRCSCKYTVWSKQTSI